LEKLYGNQGDDKMWIGGKIVTDAFAHGGTGDDTIYGGYEVAGNQYIYGNAGRDTIRTDWWSKNGTGEEVAAGDEYIWGDYKYGADNLDKDLWGDADRIYGGNADGAYYQKIYAGDGDDYIKQGENWLYGLVYGETGDDTIVLGEDYTGFNAIFGGDGDDTWVNTKAYGDREGVHGVAYYFGGDGNDYIATSHEHAGDHYLYGGRGEDIIVQGDYGVGGGVGFLVGGDGDDKIYGGNVHDASGNMWIYGDSVGYDDSDEAALLMYYNEDAPEFAWVGNETWFEGNPDDYDNELGWKRESGDDLI
jgi:Ca2+-binding RTX toxin-like protein